MKIAALLSSVSATLAAFRDPRQCSVGNNCNRAVLGIRPGLPPKPSRSADCVSYLRTTVTPAAVTVTVTVDKAPTGMVKSASTTVRPSALPRYADVCKPAEFTNACACLGVTTSSVVTAARPTVTVTTTSAAVTTAPSSQVAVITKPVTSTSLPDYCDEI